MRPGKRGLVCSESRGQAFKKRETRTKANVCEAIKKVTSESVNVTFYDNINLKMPGEYIIRGQVHTTRDGEGLIEPIYFPEIELIVAACLVDVTESKIVPIRVWSLREDTKIKKGQCIGEVSFDVSVTKTNMHRLNSVVIEKNDRWKVLWPQLEPEVSTLSDVYKNALIPLLKEFCDIFSIHKNDIGLTNMVHHEIDTGSVRPIACQCRRIPFGLEEKVDKLIQDLADKNIIRPSQSPWNAPLVVIPKKNGDLRLTVDYRKLNSITKRPIYPIPDANQLFDTLNGSALFTTLDLSSGYYNVPMKSEDIGKTAFSTRTNHWEFVRMPMGISTAPATFQRLMHKIFEKEKWHQCLIYLDDILVFSKDLQEHIDRLRTIFERIRASGVKLSPKKCNFLKSEVSYLGHTISQSGVKTDERKIKKVLEWPIPKSMEDLRSFLGLCGYYRKFINNYSKIVSPLEAACKEKWNKKKTKKSSPLEWTAELNKSFEELKVALTSAPVLVFPSKDGRFILDTDASHGCIGAVLSQIQGSEEKVIAYASRKLSQSEKQYCITRKELLSVYNFVIYFKHYLLGRPFTVRTDHRSLCWLLNWKEPNTSQYCRWRQELEIYDMDVQYRKGESHINADSLSRIPDCGQCELIHLEPKRKRNVRIIPNIEKVAHVYCRRVGSMEEKIDQTSDTDLRTIITLLKEKKLQQKNPKELENASAYCKQLWEMRHNLRFRGDLLYLLSGQRHYRLLVPQDCKNDVIKTVHETLAHVGLIKTLGIVKDQFYWKNMDLDVKLCLASCKHCARRKNAKICKHELGDLSGNKPFEKISMDIAGPLPIGNNGEKYILGIIDNYSRYVALIPLRQATASEVAKALLKHWIVIFGTPESIHSDRGLAFENQLLQELCNILNIKKTRSSPYYPQGNGMVERLFRTVKDMVFATVSSTGRKWPDVLPLVERALRCTKHACTNFSPYEIVFGRSMPHAWISMATPKDRFRRYEEYIKEIQRYGKMIEELISSKKKKKEEKYAECREGYKIGDRVMAKIFPECKGMLNPRYDGPFEVVKFLSKWSYRLKNCETGKEIERNYYHLKRFRGESSKLIRKKTAHTSIETNDHRNKVPIGVQRHSIVTKRYPQRTHRKPTRYGYTRVIDSNCQ